MAKNVTTTSIAKRAGVSQSTVSRVINNYRGINRVKRESVLAAMRELGYYANRNVKRRVGIVICPLPEQKNMMALEFFGNQIAAQEACLQEAEAESTVINLAAGAASLGGGLPHGCIFAGAGRHDDLPPEGTIRQLRFLDVPGT